MFLTVLQSRNDVIANSNNIRTIDNKGLLIYFCAEFLNIIYLNIISLEPKLSKIGTESALQLI